jgi:hypothetical protein
MIFTHPSQHCKATEQVGGTTAETMPKSFVSNYSFRAATCNSSATFMAVGQIVGTSALQF